MGTTSSQCEGICSVDKLNTGNTAWLLAAGALVMLMTPGLGFFYGGLARQKHFLSTLVASMLALAVVSIQWFLWGYTLTYSMNSSNSFIGNFDRVVLHGVGSDPHYNAQTVPEICYMFYELMFAIVTPAIVFGGAAERVTLTSYIVFLFVWSTFVYDFIAYWVWNANGWLSELGALDFAGGGPVHVTSGFAALAYAIVLKPRQGFDKGETFLPHNYSHIILGTALLWFGWFGFNGGSAYDATARAGMAVTVTHLSASVGGLTWMFLDYRFPTTISSTRKLSSLSFCSGAVAGLVTITPGAGYVSVPSSLVFGVLAGYCCRSATKIKAYFKFDDSFEVFAIHGVGGALGSLLTGIFAQSSIFGLDGAASPGGWVSGHWAQVGYQLAGILAIASWSFVVTTIILHAMKFLGLQIRVDEAGELLGDQFLMGEEASHIDYPVTDVKRSDRSGTVEMRETQPHQKVLDAIDEASS